MVAGVKMRKVVHMSETQAESSAKATSEVVVKKSEPSEMERLEAEWEDKLRPFIEASIRSDVILREDLAWRANAVAE
jgi:hypothetical protein